MLTLIINEVMIQTPKHIPFPHITGPSPRKLFEARKVAGSDTYKQSKRV